MSRSPALSPERWRALEPLLDAALELPVEQRDAFVQRMCADDADMRRELSLLLAGCDQVANGATRLELPAAARFAGLWDEGLDQVRLVEALAGSYSIEGELGRGGAAIVYRARNVQSGQLVALKVMRTMVSPLGPLRFRREIALAARLQHPCILSPLESGECAERLWYTMPLVEGESLRERLQRERSLAVPVTLRILEQVADALECAHSHGVIHRDLKPDNILLAAEHALVADFGVAKALVAAGSEPSPRASARDLSTATGVTVGTPAYMAPEQAGGAPRVDHRADLYALGLIAYEMLAGRAPFEGTSRQELLTAQLSARPVPVGERRRDVPPALARLVTRLLAKVADERPSSATEVRHELSRCAR